MESGVFGPTIGFHDASEYLLNAPEVADTSIVPSPSRSIFGTNAMAAFACLG